MAETTTSASHLDLETKTKQKNSAFALTPAPNASSASAAGFAALIPGNSPAEIVFTSGISSFLSLYNAAIVGRLLLSWWPQAPQAIVSPLATLTDPYLSLFRGSDPAAGGNDRPEPHPGVRDARSADELRRGAAVRDAAGGGAGESKGKKKTGLAPRRVPPRAGRWGVPSLVVLRCRGEQERRSQQ